jgi:hypothetical protein
MADRRIACSGPRRHRDAMNAAAELLARIDRVCQRVATAASHEAADELNDLLSEGYACALMTEQHIVALDERVVELLMRPDGHDGPLLRALTVERHAAAQSVERLRHRLAAVHDHYVSLTAR